MFFEKKSSISTFCFFFCAIPPGLCVSFEAWAFPSALSPPGIRYLFVPRPVSFFVRLSLTATPSLLIFPVPFVLKFFFFFEFSHSLSFFARQRQLYGVFCTVSVSFFLSCSGPPVRPFWRRPLVTLLTPPKAVQPTSTDPFPPTLFFSFCLIFSFLACSLLLIGSCSIHPPVCPLAIFDFVHCFSTSF